MMMCIIFANDSAGKFSIIVSRFWVVIRLDSSPLAVTSRWCWLLLKSEMASPFSICLIMGSIHLSRRGANCGVWKSSGALSTGEGNCLVRGWECVQSRIIISAYQSTLCKDWLWPSLFSNSQTAFSTLSSLSLTLNRGRFLWWLIWFKVISRSFGAWMMGKVIRGLPILWAIWL